jgi:outer membrane protein OmpA-like peptidoglycan-associated protein
MNMETRRGIGAKLASLLVAGGLVMSATVCTALAQGAPSERDILNALKPVAPKTRSLTADPVRQNPEEQRFIESVRKTRSLSTDERQKMADIAKDKPKIDLEIYFNYNSADIAQRAIPDLEKLGRALSDPDLRGSVFLVSGHTDAKGGEEYNQKLSERRAQAVKKFLMERFNLSDDGLVAAGYGKEQLKNVSDPFGSENRRVQIVNLEAKQKAEK